MSSFTEGAPRAWPIVTDSGPASHNNQREHVSYDVGPRIPGLPRTPNHPPTAIPANAGIQGRGGSRASPAIHPPHSNPVATQPPHMLVLWAKTVNRPRLELKPTGDLFPSFLSFTLLLDALRYCKQTLG